MATDEQIAELGTSGQSAVLSEELAVTLCDRIEYLVRQSGMQGCSINSVEKHLPGYKSHSISPRFRELEKQGRIVRVPIEPGRPTRRFPQGSPRYLTRYDEETHRNVTVYWAPEFAPVPAGKSGTKHCPAARANSAAISAADEQAGGVSA